MFQVDPIPAPPRRGSCVVDTTLPLLETGLR
jgi:hypothetical protein